MIYILTVNYHSSALIQRLIQSLPDSSSSHYRMLIVNNSPNDHQISQLQSWQIQVLETGGNLGFGGGCNLGIEYIQSQDLQAIIWLLNPDAYFPQKTLHNYWYFIESIWLQHQKLSILGTAIMTPEGDPWFTKGLFNKRSGKIRDFKTVIENSKQAQLVESDWISGCSLMINLSRFNEAPRFDESFFLYYEDVDFCLRYRDADHLIALSPKLKIIHQASSITNSNQYNKIFHSSFSYLYFLRKHVGHFTFLIGLLKFLVNMLIKLAFQPEIGQAKYDGLVAFIKKVWSK